MKAIQFLIHSNIYIALAGVALTVATQIQLGMPPQWHPYLFLIFFATLFEYNLHRLITIVTKPEVLQSNKHSWVKNNLTWFYVLVACSVIGFGVAVWQAKFKVLLTLAPIAALTLFYSTPITKTAKGIFRLRQIPYLKIFMIAFVWSAITIFLPVIHADAPHNHFHIATMLLERFLFVFAITIPFDIRDMDADQPSGLKTIPLKLGEKKAIQLAVVALLLFWIICCIHYSTTQQWMIGAAFTVSFASTLYFLLRPPAKPSPLYYYGILDGTMLWQGAMVMGLYYLQAAW